MERWDYIPMQSGWVRWKNRHGTNLNATWTGTDTSFSHLVLTDSINMLENDSTALREDESLRPEVLLCKTILNGFGMTFATACQHGFGPFNDPETPFVGQVAVTDGRRWKLGVYQLNKMAMQVNGTSFVQLRLRK